MHATCPRPTVDNGRANVGGADADADAGVEAEADDDADIDVDADAEPVFSLFAGFRGPEGRRADLAQRAARAHGASLPPISPPLSLSPPR